ncbi:MULTISPECIES: hypothetical protein [Halomonas]|uniref:Uncharacterized protein n=1 Tax=Halomonas casei TaxID=2742613 RepID=A0ABR9EY69_9GAMM|nr:MULTISPECIES: hypothetical protein [Halomonas]MBE0399116.1 hypothetical protein [Halomonas casei]PCC22902.1 hypothetical protein CIK78_13030 [Halomonas sp. JB37]
MANRVWIPALAVVALMLSACGDSQEDPAVAPADNAEVADDEMVREDEGPAAAENAAEMATPEEVENDIEARQAEEQLERADALRDDETEESNTEGATQSETLEAGEETLAADPDDALNEDSAMPGEATRSDVDEMIAETERRFEEAEKRLEEQFQEVEQQAPAFEPMESEDIPPSWETNSSIPERTPLDDGLESTDVDALIEDTERRFEEAEQRLEEQFKEMESEEAQSGPALPSERQN